MKLNPRELRQRAAEIDEKRQAVLAESGLMIQSAEKENRGLNDTEKGQYDARLSEAKELEDRSKRLIAAAEEIEKTVINEPATRQAPAIRPNGIKKDNEKNAYEAYIRYGDMGGVSHMRADGVRVGGRVLDQVVEIRASNDTTMNITTDADGGYIDFSDHYRGIIARRDENMLANVLGVQKFTGKGSTFDVPVDAEDDGEFVETNESAAFDRDAPALNKVTLTLLMYTKKVDLTYQILQDEDANLLPFLTNFVGRGMAKTHNYLLLTEVAANGGTLKTFASATVIAVDELEDILFNDALWAYLDMGTAAWVMRPTVHGEISKLDDTSTRRYNANASANQVSLGAPLLGFPVYYSLKSGATAASAKSIYFGDWSYVGLYESPSITVVRDPYTRSSYGEVVINYHFRADYGVLQSEAIGFGVHPSA